MLLLKQFVLIETLWNVKITFPLMINRQYIRINRNIVECKVVKSKNIIIFFYSINRNIVECKVERI